MLNPQYGKYKSVMVIKSDGSTIPSNEPVFVLRAQDILAPVALKYYADLIDGATGMSAEANGIRDFADRMIAWPIRKLPD